LAIVDARTSLANDSFWPVGISADDCRLYAFHSPVATGALNSIDVLQR
jgi:hypothetical protein